MTLPKISSKGKDPAVVDVLYAHTEIAFSDPEEMLSLDPAPALPIVEERILPLWPIHPRPMLPSRIAIIGNYLPRRCGIATFTTDLCDAIHAEYEATELLALPVNDTEEGYSYPARIRFELSQDELASYRQAADFLNFSNIRSGLRAARIWNFRRSSGRAHPGTPAPPSDAHRYYPSYGAARAQFRSAHRHGGNRRAIGPPDRDEPPVGGNPAGSIPCANFQD
jgi:hypothetical protein